MNLLITGAFGRCEEQFNDFAKLGYKVWFLQNEVDELPLPYNEVGAVICNGLFLHHDIEKFTSLKLIHITSAGYDRIPMKYIKEHGIKIYNAKGVYSVPMAEFALCGVLSLYKRMQFFAENQKKHVWEKYRIVPELFGKKVCIVGCGSVGTECAVRFNAMGCEIIGVDIAPYDNDKFEIIHPIEKLDEILSISDVCVLTLPLTEQTKHLFNNDRFNRFKSNAVLVNISRGDIVDTDSLIDALKSNKLFGAVLDVFETEPLMPESPLWDMSNVIITPHNSFVGEGNNERLFGLILNNFRKEDF